MEDILLHYIQRLYKKEQYGGGQRGTGDVTEGLCIQNSFWTGGLLETPLSDILPPGVPIQSYPLPPLFLSLSSTCLIHLLALCPLFLQQGRSKALVTSWRMSLGKNEGSICPVVSRHSTDV